MARVVDDVLTTSEPVIQETRKARVPALCKDAGQFGGLTLLIVKVDIEVFRLENFEIEVLVLHLVPTEVLRFGRLNSNSAQDDDQA